MSRAIALEQGPEWIVRSRPDERARWLADLRARGPQVHQAPAWHVDVPEVFYTVGIHDRTGCPEVLLLGLPREGAIALLNSVIASVLAGRRLAPNRRLRSEDNPRALVEFVPVHEAFRTLLPALDIENPRRAVPMLQLLHSDAWGRLPGDPDYGQGREGEYPFKPITAPKQPRWDRTPWARWANPNVIHA